MRKDILDKAIQCVCADREHDYGTPEDSFNAIAKYWSVYLKREVSAHDVAILMTLLKIARIETGRFKEDSYIDACGYLACGGEISERDNTNLQE